VVDGNSGTTRVNLRLTPRAGKAAGEDLGRADPADSHRSSRRRGSVVPRSLVHRFADGASALGATIRPIVGNCAPSSLTPRKAATDCGLPDIGFALGKSGEPRTRLARHVPRIPAFALSGRFQAPRPAPERRTRKHSPAVEIIRILRPGSLQPRIAEIPLTRNTRQN
jgi:hypothetical protein